MKEVQKGTSNSQPKQEKGATTPTVNKHSEPTPHDCTSEQKQPKDSVAQLSKEKSAETGKDKTIQPSSEHSKISESKKKVAFETTEGNEKIDQNLLPASKDSQLFSVEINGKKLEFERTKDKILKLRSNANADKKLLFDTMDKEGADFLKRIPEEFHPKIGETGHLYTQGGTVKNGIPNWIIETQQDTKSTIYLDKNGIDARREDFRQIRGHNEIAINPETGRAFPHEHRKDYILNENKRTMFKVEACREIQEDGRSFPEGDSKGKWILDKKYQKPIEEFLKKYNDKFNPTKQEGRSVEIGDFPNYEALLEFYHGRQELPRNES